MSNRNRDSDQPESSINEVVEISMREPRISDLALADYFDANKHVINHRGHVDECKVSGKIRMLSMNVHGCRPENDERLQRIRTSIEKHQIDVALFNEASTK